MSSTEPGNGPSKHPPRDISEVDERIKKARAAGESRRLWKTGFDKPPHSAAGLAFRVSVELISALAVGLAVGLALDRWLDTGPVLMVVFLVLGFAAGLLNVYRMANRMIGLTGYQEKTGASGTNTVTETPEKGKDRSG